MLTLQKMWFLPARMDYYIIQNRGYRNKTLPMANSIYVQLLNCDAIHTMNSVLSCHAKFARRTHNSSKKLHIEAVSQYKLPHWIALHISPALKCQSSHRVIQCKRGYTHGDCHHQVQLCTTQHFSQVDHDAAWAAPSLLAPLSTFFLDPLFWGFSSSWFFTTGLNCCKRKNEWNHKVSGQVYWRVKINHTRVC